MIINRLLHRKTILLVRIGLTFLMGISGAAFGALNQAPGNAQRPQAANYQDQDPLCGPRSLAGAAARLGIDIDLKRLAKLCRVTPQGTSMLDLKKAAPAFHLEAQGVRLDWASLTRLGTPAVLFLSGNHYSFVDPRERPEGEKRDEIRLYDFPRTARWVSREELEKKWRGEALVIIKSSIAPPQLQFDSLLEDYGPIYQSQEPLTRTINIQNKGAGFIQIYNVEKSCGCAEAQLDKMIFGPGESGTLTIELDLAGRRGIQRQMIVIESTDPVQPRLAVTVQGVVVSPIHVSTDAINLGQVAPGCRSYQSFTVTDRGDGSLRLTQWDYKPQSRGAASAPVIKASWRPTDRSYDEDLCADQGVSDSMVPLIRGKGDRRYSIDLEIKIPEDCAPGIQAGLFTLKTSDPKYSLIEVPLVYQVMVPVHASPGKLSFGIINGRESVSKKMVVSRADGKFLGRVTCQSLTEGGEAHVRPEVRVAQLGGDKAELEVTLNPATDPTVKGGFYRGQILVQAGSQSKITIPWTCIIQYGKDEKRSAKDGYLL